LKIIDKGYYYLTYKNKNKMANFQQTINLAHAPSGPHTIVGKDDAGNVGPMTNIGLYSQSIPAGAPTQSFNASTNQVTFNPGTGYGTSLFTFRGINALGAFAGVDVTVIDPAPIAATHLELT
jgi:hypothetical protein